MTNPRSNEEVTALTVPSPENITITPVGLVIKGTISFDDWASLGPVLGKYHKGIAWAVGDWISTGEYKFGEMYGQALDTTGLSLGRLRNLKSLADRVPFENRVAELSISHHEAVAPFSHEMQIKLLMMALDQGLDRDELRKIAAELNAVLPDGEETDDEQVVIDPPAPIPHGELVKVARRVVAAWEVVADQSSRYPLSMTFMEAMGELVDLVGEDDA